jgi:hypothetical protein
VQRDVIYGGWFFFVGEMVTAGELLSYASESPQFSYFFTRAGPCPKEFRDEPRLAIEFEAHIKYNKRLQTHLK